MSAFYSHILVVGRDKVGEFVKRLEAAGYGIVWVEGGTILVRRSEYSAKKLYSIIRRADKELGTSCAVSRVRKDVYLI